MKTGDEIAIDLEPGKTMVLRFLTGSEAHPDGNRTVFFELNGQPREADIRDKSLRSAVPERTKADPAKPGHVGAPIPSTATQWAREFNHQSPQAERLVGV